MAIPKMPMSPITVIAAAMMVLGAAGLAGPLGRQEGLMAVIVLLAVTAFVAGRKSPDVI